MLNTSPVKVRHGLLVFGKHGYWVLMVIAVFAVFNRMYQLAILALGAFFTWMLARVWATLALSKVGVLEEASAETVFLGEDVQIKLEVINAKLLPVPWLELERTHYSYMGQGLGSPYEVEDSRLVGRFGWLLWYQRSICQYTVTPQRRGRYMIGVEQVRGGDPFGLFEKVGVVPRPTTLVVYPHLLAPEFLDLGKQDPLGSKPDRNFLFTDPLLIAGIRNYQPYDPLRQVNWKASARLQSLKSNVWQGKAAAKCMVYLETGSIKKTVWEGKQLQLALEIMISTAATIISDMTMQRQEWGFLTDAMYPSDESRPYSIIPSSGNLQQHWQEVMLFLAQFEETKCFNIQYILSQVVIPAGATVVVISAKADQETATVLQELAVRHSVLWLLLDQQAAEESSVLTRPLVPGWAENRELADLLLLGKTNGGTEMS